MEPTDWLDEARESRKLLYLEWEAKGQPTGCFYTWLLGMIENQFLRQRQKINQTMGNNI